MVVRWTMEAADLISMSQLYSRKAWWFIRVAPAVALFLGLVSFGIGADPATWLPPLVFAILMGFYLFVWIPRSVNRQARSLIGEDVVFWVDDEGTHQDVAGSHLWVEWRALTAVSDNAVVIIIRRDRMPSNFIPKRAFASSSDADAFLAFVRSRLGSAEVAA
jgi:hypothetical protein